MEGDSLQNGQQASVNSFNERGQSPVEGESSRFQ